MKQKLIILILLSAILLVSTNSCNNDDTKDTTNEIGSQKSYKDLILGDLKNKYADLSENDICINTPESFSNLTMVGFFAHDAGCKNYTHYYKGKSTNLDNQLITKLMKENNFDTNPLKITAAFHIEVLNIRNTLLRELPAGMDTISIHFHKPIIIADGDTYVSSIFVQTPSGMLPENNYYESVAIFDKTNGALIDQTKVNKFTIGY